MFRVVRGDHVRVTPRTLSGDDSSGMSGFERAALTLKPLTRPSATLSRRERAVAAGLLPREKVPPFGFAQGRLRGG